MAINAACGLPWPVDWLLSGRVNTLRPALSVTVHGGGAGKGPPASFHADKCSPKLQWSDPAVAAGSGGGPAGRRGVVMPGQSGAD